MASYNCLTSLPKSIGECHVLEKIRVVNNHITAARNWNRQFGPVVAPLVIFPKGSRHPKCLGGSVGNIRK